MGMMLNRTLIRQVLSATAGQLEPHLSNLERALGRPLDAPSFVMGMLTGVLVQQRVDIVRAAEAMPEEFSVFLAEVEKRERRDLGPYRPGVLTSGYHKGGLHFDPGQEIRWRSVDDRFAEVAFPPYDGFTVRWLEKAQIAGTE